MSEQESCGGVGPGAMVAPREPLNVISTILSTLPTPPRVTPVVTTPVETTSPEIRAMQATMAEMANTISTLAQVVSRLNESNRSRRSVSVNSHRSDSQ